MFLQLDSHPLNFCCWPPEKTASKTFNWLLALLLIAIYLGNYFFPTVSTIFFSTQKIFEIMGKTFFFHYYYFFYFFLLRSSKIYGDGKLNHQEKEIGKKLIFVIFSFQRWVKKVQFPQVFFPRFHNFFGGVV